MPNIANDPTRKSWIEVLDNSDFPIQNIEAEQLGKEIGESTMMVAGV